MKKPLRWVDERDVLAIHDRQLVLHGGVSGMRDRGLLLSALARPHQHHAYAKKSTIVEMAALYTAGLVRNHPFIDGNKRTGFTVGVLFLELNGLTFTATEADATQAIMALAGGELDEKSYSDWLGLNVKQAKGRR